ncbi:MAG: hypothetical protein HeimC3_24500 [Candidatus Heimdallarchaeota archaeon LC_3]|nr:MAG: hypothetical protein HeimC3_24500 [Candidatus Heimdallarchaeota archaeon LC_3]
MAGNSNPNPPHEDFFPFDSPNLAYAKCVPKGNNQKVFDDIKTFVAGFPGPGLVGSIASRHLAYELDLEVIGFIRSPLIAPQATFFDGLLAYPYRMYGKKGFDLGILVSESPLSERAHFYIANALLDWLEKIKAEELIVLDGYSASSDNQEAFFIAEPEIRDRNKSPIEKVKLAIPEYKNQLGTGYVGGIAGALLNEGIVRRSIVSFAVLAPVVNPRIPSPKSASKLIEFVNSYKSVDVDIESLLDHSKRIEKNLDEFARKQEKIDIMDKTRKDIGLYY